MPTQHWERDWILSVLLVAVGAVFTCCLLSPQPTVTATPKSTKNGKPGYDDTTLPLMEKNQGELKCVCVLCVTVAVFACLEDQGIRWERGREKTPGALSDWQLNITVI